MSRLLVVFLIIASTTFSGIALALEIPPVESTLNGNAIAVPGSFEISQRPGLFRSPTYRPRVNPGIQRQQQLRQQQLQRQRMEQQRRQQAVQRQRMLEQQRRQQAIIRQRQQQVMAQRQRIIEQQRLAQARLRQTLLQRQTTAVTQAAGAARRQIAGIRLRAEQQRRLRLIREQRAQTEARRGSERATVAALPTALRARSALAATQSAAVAPAIAATRGRLQSLQGRRLRPGSASTSQATRQAELRRQMRSCQGGTCRIGARACSFHGDTLVYTARGMIPISDISVDTDYVWARDEPTGAMSWKPVIAHYSNRYEETVELTIQAQGAAETQTIRTNRIHPFFVLGAPNSPMTSVAANSTEWGVGALDGNQLGYWVPAEHLTMGDRLLQADGQTAVVEETIISYQPFEAFNLSVSEFATFFVGSNEQAEHSVWVHNECTVQTRRAWTPNPSENLSRMGNLRQHWADHRADFPGLRGPVQYQRAAIRFLHSPPPGTFTRYRPNGDVVRWNPRSNTFAVMDRNGTPRTMYKPSPEIHRQSSNREYFRRQGTLSPPDPENSI